MRHFYNVELNKADAERLKAYLKVLEQKLD